jgi:penicillin-binding protein 1A
MSSAVVPGRAARHANGRSGKVKGKGKRRHRLRKILLIVLGLSAIGIGVVGGFVYQLAQVPLPEKLPDPQISTIFDAKGRQIGILPVEENRRVLPWKDIPEVMRKATLAAEDRTFYEHGALSYKGLLRAAWTNVTGGRVAQGGSTITQQYVKNAYDYVGNDRNVLRKAREAVVATKLEDRYTKDQILEFYLNTIYFGRGAYGVEAASLSYFGHSVKKGLSPQEAAFLAGAIRNPEFYSSTKNIARGTERRNHVLGIMAELGWLTPEQAAEAKTKPLKVKPRKKASIGVAASQAPFYMEKVRLYLIDRLGEDVVNRGGLRVVTTLDLDLQKDAKAAVEGVLDEDNDPRAALVAIDTKTGAIKAMYAGRNFSKRQFNYATDAQRQAGSTMKPFVLAEALDEGLSIKSRLDGPRCLVVNGSQTCNYGMASYGEIDLLKATRLSVNTVYMRLIDRVGPSAVASLARRAGMESTLTKSERGPELPDQPSLALGAGTVSTLQLTSSFATFANRGVHVEPYMVTRIQDSEGRVLEAHKTNPVRAIDENVADTVNLALQGVIDAGTGTAADFGCPAAGKTGTTNDSVDARFVGYTPEMVASVWMGYDNQAKRLENIHGLSAVSGGTLPAQVWHDFMTAATKGECQGEFEKPTLDGEVLNPAPSSTSTSSSTTSSTVQSTTSTTLPETTTTFDQTTTTRDEGDGEEPPPTRNPGRNTDAYRSSRPPPGRQALP